MSNNEVQGLNFNGNIGVKKIQINDYVDAQGILVLNRRIKEKECLQESRFLYPNIQWVINTFEVGYVDSFSPLHSIPHLID